MSKNQPNHDQRLSALERRIDGLENHLLTAIRDLSLIVGQMVSLRQAADHTHDHHHEPAQPELVFQVHQTLTDNTMYRVYQDAYDHPINPGQVHIHTRREVGSNQFDNLEVDENLATLLTSEFQRQTGGTVNVAFYVEVYRQSDAPIDASSFLVDQTPAAEVPPKSLQPAIQPTPELPAVAQGVFAQLTPAQQMQQMVQGLTEQVRARTVSDSRPGLPGADQSR